MKHLSILVLTFMLSTTTSLAGDKNPAENSNFLSLQQIVCYFQDTQFMIEVPMPDKWDLPTMELMSQMICNSVHETTTVEMKNEHLTIDEDVTIAVCDTDTSCMLWDKYKKYGIKYIYTAPEHRHDPKDEYNTWEVHCTNHGMIQYSVLDAELELVCDNPSEVTGILLESANMHGGMVTDFSINYLELQELWRAGYAPINRSHNRGPSTKAFIELLREHPEAAAYGMFVSDQGAKDRCTPLGKGWASEKECIEANKGLDLNEIFVRRWYTDPPVWFINFCSEASEEDFINQRLWCTWD